MSRPTTKFKSYFRSSLSIKCNKLTLKKTEEAIKNGQSRETQDKGRRQTNRRSTMQHRNQKY